MISFAKLVYGNKIKWFLMAKSELCVIFILSLFAAIFVKINFPVAIMLTTMVVAHLLTTYGSFFLMKHKYSRYLWLSQLLNRAGGLTIMLVMINTFAKAIVSPLWNIAIISMIIFGILDIVGVNYWKKDHSITKVTSLVNHLFLAISIVNFVLLSFVAREAISSPKIIVWCVVIICILMSLGFIPELMSKLNNQLWT